jgi:hypothetical protein
MAVSTGPFIAATSRPRKWPRDAVSEVSMGRWTRRRYAGDEKRQRIRQRLPAAPDPLPLFAVTHSLIDRPVNPQTAGK